MAAHERFINIAESKQKKVGMGKRIGGEGEDLSLIAFVLSLFFPLLPSCFAVRMVGANGD